MHKKTNRIFLILFTIGFVALLTGSWLQFIPFSITEDLGFITGAGNWAGADLAGVFSQRDIPAMMQTIFNGPIAPDQFEHA
jgi:hypothetical protein